MRCEQVQENVADYIAETLPDAMQEELMDHLHGCSSCRSELDDLRELWSDMAHIPVPVFQTQETRAAIAAATISGLMPWRATRMNSRFALRTASVLVVMAGMAAGVGLLVRHRQQAEPLATSVEPKPLSDLPKGSGHTLGSDSAPISLVEYGDYECPPCFSSYAVVQELMRQHPGMIRYEYRHFPITQIHKNALTAALAAEAAGEQGKFWEMHDLLLSSQVNWSHSPQAKESFTLMAQQVGLDVKAFESALESSELERRITAGATAARQAGIASVPTLFINGSRYEFGADRPDILRSIVLSLINTRLGLGRN
jgi:protein-disulfide isomerase